MSVKVLKANVTKMIYSSLKWEKQNFDEIGSHCFCVSVCVSVFGKNMNSFWMNEPILTKISGLCKLVAANLWVHCTSAQPPPGRTWPAISPFSWRVCVGVGGSVFCSGVHFSQSKNARLLNCSWQKCKQRAVIVVTCFYFMQNLVPLRDLTFQPILKVQFSSKFHLMYLMQRYLKTLFFLPSLRYPWDQCSPMSKASNFIHTIS